MLSIFGEVGGYMANHVIIKNVSIKKMYKQLFLIKLMIGIILRREQSCAKSCINIQKDQ